MGYGLELFIAQLWCEVESFIDFAEETYEPASISFCHVLELC